MKNIEVRNGIHYVRVVIPDDVKDKFEKPVFKQSLRTRDPHIAAARAAPILEGIWNRIAKARNVAPKLAASAGLISPDDAFEAIERWRRATIDAAYLAHFNGKAVGYAKFGSEHKRLSDLRYALKSRRWSDVADFDVELVAALQSQGIEISMSHPAVSKARVWFGDAWCEVEHHIDDFRRDDFSGWALEGSAKVPPLAAGPQPASGLKHGGDAAETVLSGLLTRFIESTRPEPKDESEIRLYVSRLIEFFGDIPITEVRPGRLDQFLVQLRRLPTVKSKEFKRLTFGEIIEKYGDDPAFDDRRLANKTIRTKWFGAYNRMFKWAVNTLGLAENPVSKIMPSKRDDVPNERYPWSSADIKHLFGTPLFTGASDVGDWGYRDKPGDLIERDHKYWLPIIGLWSGMRLEEIGAMRTEEVHRVDGVWAFDLRKRPIRGDRRVKGRESQRLVPIHRKLIELGFLDYVAARDEWLFPKIMAAKRDYEQATSNYSSWFGHWRKANDIYQPRKDFYSFRHSFKDACREAKVAEDVHDLLTGHAGAGNQKTSRNYGSGGSMKLLARSMNAVRYPTFPDLPLAKGT